MNDEIYVSKPFLPPLDEYISYLKIIWENEVLTNNGPMVQKLGKSLKDILKVKNLIITANATLAIQLAIKALDLSGEIITTPFTFVATTSAINWQNCKPVFVDIDKETFNIDPSKIEEKITKKTTAVLGVHIFSNPCDVEAIEKIAKKYGLKVIYDAAHALFVNYKGKSLLEYGDVSIASFHAIKLFNTVEGGACITQNDIVANRLNQLREFGFNKDRIIIDNGINAKMTEIHASMGLASLKYIDDIKKDRKKKYQLYKGLLSTNKNITFQLINEEHYNFSYMPVVFKNEKMLLTVMGKMEENNIFPKRYFYPSLNKVKAISSAVAELPIAEDISNRILCLPLYYTLKEENIEFICEIINKNCK